MGITIETITVDKQKILNEIRRTAAANGGVPLGRAKFLQATGIKQSDWEGKIWVRWSDAIREAGFEPNQLQTAYDDELIIERFIDLARELGRFPVAVEIKMKARSDSSFPSHTTFGRFGSRADLAKRVIDYCQSRDGYGDVIAWCAPRAALSAGSEVVVEDDTGERTATKDGYVYLAVLNVGREKRYKIGKAVLVERRRDQLSIQLPEDLELGGVDGFDEDEAESKGNKGAVVLGRLLTA